MVKIRDGKLLESTMINDGRKGQKKASKLDLNVDETLSGHDVVILNYLRSFSSQNEHAPCVFRTFRSYSEYIPVTVRIEVADTIRTHSDKILNRSNIFDEFRRASPSDYKYIAFSIRLSSVQHEFAPNAEF